MHAVQKIDILCNIQEMLNFLILKSLFVSTLCLTYHIYIIIILAMPITLWKFCFPYLKWQCLQPACCLSLHDIMNFMSKVLDYKTSRKRSTWNNSGLLMLIGWHIILGLFYLQPFTFGFRLYPLHWELCFQKSNSCSHVFTGTCQGFSRTGFFTCKNKMSFLLGWLYSKVRRFQMVHSSDHLVGREYGQSSTVVFCLEYLKDWETFFVSTRYRAYQI